MMQTDDIVRRVRRVVRRESPYRHDVTELRTIVASVMGREPRLRPGLVIRRAAAAAIRGVK